MTRLLGRWRPSHERDDEILGSAVRADVGTRTVSGIRWALTSRGLTEAVAFGSTLVLARLVSPSEYGYAAAAIIFPTLAEMLLYEGFGTQLVRNKEATRKEAGVALSLSLMLGLVCFLLLVGASILATPAIGGRQAFLFELSALAFLLSAPNVVPQALLQRDLAFRSIALRDSTAMLVATVSTIAMAAAGWGAAAVIGGLLVNRAVTTVMLQVITEPIGPRWDRALARKVVGFGAFTSLAGVLTLSRRNIDYFLLSFFLPTRQVGLYYRAYSIGVDYQNKITVLASRLILPVYARATDAADMWNMRRRFARLQMAVVVPVLAVFVVCAPQLIPVLFGARWEDAVLPSQILALVPLSALLGNGTGPLLVTAGRPGVVVAVNAASVGFYALTILAFASQGFTTLCVAVAVFNMVFTLASTFYLVNRVLGFDMGEVVIELAGPVCAALPTVVIGLPVVAAFDPSLPALLGTLACTGLFAVVSYSVIMRLAFPGTWAEVVRVTGRVLGRFAPKFAQGR